MRNLKRFLAMTLTMLMVVGCFSFASFGKNFEDVYDYAEAIDALSDIDVIKGYEDGNFGPDDLVARWHMALWIAKLETGKVGDDDLVTVWKAESNFTDFTDVNVDQYIGAINYAADEEIIIGTTATTFEPDAGITYQDALTMVVRALGFGGKTMDAGYPWKYINKANELGLGEGISDVAYTDVLTRGQTAQILYNAFFAVDADGETYAENVFNFSTIVITGTNKMKMVGTESISKKDYVCFNILNKNGTINSAVTYYLPVAAFQDAFDSQDLVDATVPENFVGASFRVTSSDGFKSLDVVIPCPAATFTEETLTTTAKSDNDNAYIILGEETYKAVKSFSSLYNTQGIKGNTPEIFAFATTATATSGGYAKVDANYNILSASGDIVAYYRPDVTKSYAAPYVQLLASGVYKPIVNATQDGQLTGTSAVVLTKELVESIGGAWIASATNEYAQLGNVYTPITSKNAHSTAIAYDDNNDGMYDRIFYTYHTFAQLTVDDDGHAVIDGVDSGAAGVFVDEDGLAIDRPASGSYIRYSKNALSGIYTVYEIYEVNTGLVSAVSGTKITIGGTEYTLAVPNYVGSDSTNSSIDLLNKRVNFYLDNGNVVQLDNYANNGKYIVFDNFTGMTTSGYGTALVYVENKTASMITIASIDGYTYQNYILNANAGSLGNVTNGIATGTLFRGTQDALGYWNLETVKGDFYAPTDAADVITFKNGIANSDSKYFYENGAIKPFAQFLTTSSTLYIVYNAEKDIFYTTTGIPMDDAKLTINKDGYMKLVLDGYKATYIYIYDGAIEGKTTLTSWAPYDYDAVIYVAPNTAESADTTAATGTLLGQVYYYGKVLDMISGQYISVYSGGVYNKKLEAGKFYTVKNGYVESEIEVYTKDSPIQEGLLVFASRFNSVINNTEGYNVDLSALTYLYTLNADKNVTLNGDGSINNSVVGDGAAYAYVPVYYYTGANASSRVILQVTAATDLSGTKVLTATEATKVVDVYPYYATEKAKVTAYTYLALAPYADAACTATTAITAPAAVNYFNIGKNAYEVLTAVNAKLVDRTVNDNTYDKWTRIFAIDTYGTMTEVINWSIDFTTVTPSLGTPIYSMAISRVFDEYTTANKALTGYYLIKTMYNGQIYNLYVYLNLNAAPIYLDNLTATIYNVDAFKGPITLPSGGWIDPVLDAFDPYTGELDLTKVSFEDVWDVLGDKANKYIGDNNANGDYDELPIYVGQDGIMDTGRIYLTGVKGAALDNKYDVQIYVKPLVDHVEEAHGQIYAEEYSTRALLTYEQIFNSPVTFNDEGEAVVDIPGLYNMARVFVCSYEGCGHHTLLTKDQYVYIIRVGSADNDEWVTLVEGLGRVYEEVTVFNGVDVNTSTVIDDDAIVFAPDWNVRVYSSLLGNVNTALPIEKLVTYDPNKGDTGYFVKGISNYTSGESISNYTSGGGLTITLNNGTSYGIAKLCEFATIVGYTNDPTSVIVYDGNGNVVTVEIVDNVVTIGTVDITLDSDFDADEVSVALDDTSFDAYTGTVDLSKINTLNVDEAEIVINLNETQALNKFAWPSTTMTLLGNNVRYNGWGAESITYALTNFTDDAHKNFGFNTPQLAGSLSATNIHAASTGYTYFIRTDPNTFNHTIIFDSELELCKNFAITYTGKAYKSFAGTTAFPGLAVKQVLPFEPYYSDIQFAEDRVDAMVDSQLYWISVNLANPAEIFG